jgi:hypothetical protein
MDSTRQIVGTVPLKKIENGEEGGKEEEELECRKGGDKLV